jgi:hypothetical protein
MRHVGTTSRCDQAFLNAGGPPRARARRLRAARGPRALLIQRLSSLLLHPSMTDSHQDRWRVKHRRLRQKLLRRLARNGVVVAGFIFVALAIGATGYHVFADLEWLDALLNAAMILTGMGPVNPVTTPAAKVFATVYALFSGVFFLTMVAVLLAPALSHFLHRFHLELNDQDSPGR